MIYEFIDVCYILQENILKYWNIFNIVRHSKQIVEKSQIEITMCTEIKKVKLPLYDIKVITWCNVTSIRCKCNHMV